MLIIKEFKIGKNGILSVGAHIYYEKFGVIRGTIDFINIFD